MKEVDTQVDIHGHGLIAFAVQLVKGETNMKVRRKGSGE